MFLCSPVYLQSVVSLNVCYPHAYPSCPPHVTLRTTLARNNHRALTEQLYAFLANQQQQEEAELYMCNVIDWLQDNYHRYKHTSLPPSVTRENLAATVRDDLRMARYWIYSHHIFSKFKRKDIVDWAKDMKLTGFSMPGKPGVICVEGAVCDIEEYWARLRRLN